MSEAREINSTLKKYRSVLLKIKVMICASRMYEKVSLQN